MDTRKSGNRYEFELDSDEHELLLQLALKFKGVDIQICTYPNELYRDYLGDWKLIEYQSITRGGLATEWLFMNYHDIHALHDYTYLGQGHRERQLYRKKMKRWIDNFNELPILFQNQLIAELNDQHQKGRELINLLQ